MMWELGPDSKQANKGIVGLGPAPFATIASEGWPTEGYDGHLAHWVDDENRFSQDPLRFSGRSKEDWLELADVMLQRWLDFKNAVEQL